VSNTSEINCYLCGDILGSNISSDHIIPDALFHSGDPNRPQLAVHSKCNNLKSKEDEWFVKHLQLRCSINQVSERKFSEFIGKALKEQPDAYLVGKNPRNFVLAKGILEGISWKMNVEYDGQQLSMGEIDKKDQLRFKKYIKTMCSGLYLKHISTTKLEVPDLIVREYMYLELKCQAPLLLHTVSK
jgi:hypothetical protein